MKVKIQKQAWWLWLGLMMWLTSTVVGQSSPDTIDNLLIELWPEYDRPEVLVIYQVTLDPTTTLPVHLSFRLPGYIDSPHVVAFERDGVLVQSPPENFVVRREADIVWLDVTTPAHNFQFEYYDPQILTQQAKMRTLRYQFFAPYNFTNLVLEIQEPAGAMNVSLTPNSTESFIGSDGLRYNTIQMTSLLAGEMAEVSATYQRDMDQLSIRTLPNGSSGAVPDNSTAGERNRNLGYVLIGIGMILFLGAGGSWWWSRQKANPISRQSQPKKVQAPITTTAEFCYRCGAALRIEANFCHNCGAERRGLQSNQ